MTLAVLDSPTAAAVAATTTQTAQLAALLAPFGSADWTLRYMAGGTVASVVTHAPGTSNALTPRGYTLGAPSAYTVNAPGLTITSLVFRTSGGSDVFSLDAADLDPMPAGPIVTRTGQRLNAADALGKLLITALASLPVSPPAPVSALTFAVADTGTVDVAAAGSIVNTGSTSQAWSITPPTNCTVTPSSGTLAAGGTQALTITATAAATYSLTLVSAGATITGNAQSFVAAVAPAGFTYRDQAPQLFAGLLTDTALQADATGGYATPARGSVAGSKLDFLWGRDSHAQGPSYANVDNFSEWAWTNGGGDWINSAGAAQATGSPHFTFSSNAVTSGASAYTATATLGAQQSFSLDRWNAYIVKVTGGSRALVTPHHATLPAPTMSVTYADATTATLACTACVQLTNSTSYTQVGADVAPINVSVALEFERPTKAVASATLNITVANHTASAATINGYLANPQRNSGVVVPGLAASYPVDAGLSGESSVLLSQRYQDGSSLSDYVHTGIASFDLFATSNWSPDLFGLGAANATKLPTAYAGTSLAGKFLNKNGDLGRLSVVSSSYSADAFEPVAPGIGALRVIIPGYTGADGTNAVSSSLLGADLFYFFDKAISGLVDDLYSRFYVRIHSTPKRLSATKMFKPGASDAASYATKGGKWGLAPVHLTAFGGQASSGGGALGWSARLSVEEAPADMPLAGWQPGLHAYDMGLPNYHFGKDGGRGASLYPDRWYCIEHRLKLNTWAPSGGGASDAVFEAWVDGVKVCSYTGFKFRDGPLNYTTTPPASGLAPFRELGAYGMWLNEFQGGNLAADEDRVMFYTLMAAGTTRLGPANLTSVPSWISSMASGTWAAVPGSGTLAAINPNQNPALNPSYTGSNSTAPWDDVGTKWPRIITAWNSAAADTNSGKIYMGPCGGHDDNGSNAMMVLDLNSEAPVWEFVRAPSGSLTVGPGITLADGQEASGRYADGRVRSVHTYNGYVWLPTGHVVNVGLSFLFTLSGSRNDLVFNSVSDGEALFLSAGSTVSNGAVQASAGCYDASRNCIWWLPENSAMARYTLPSSGAINTGTLTTVGSNPNIAGYKSLCHLPDHDCILIGRADFTGHANSGWRVFDCATGAYYTPTFSGSVTGFLDAGTAQPQWYAPLGAAICWNQSTNTTAVMKLTPGANPRTDTWTISSLPVAGSNSVTPSAAVAAGTFGRAPVMPAHGGIYVFNSVSETGYFYKL